MFVLSIQVLVFALQAAVLDLFLWDLCGWTGWIFVAFDVVLLIHMLSGFREHYGATRSVLEWLMYSVSFTIKLCVYYFVVFSGRLERESSYYGKNGGIGYDVSSEIMILTRSYAFSLMMYLAPLLFTFWFGRSVEEIFHHRKQGKYVPGKVTFEVLVFCDIAVHVVLDLVDLITAFRFCLQTYTFRGRHPVLERANGVIMAIGILAHSISLPSYSSISNDESKRSANVEAIERRDIFLTRKYVALVSALVIDVPFLITRFLFWHRGYSFQVFAIKNVISIPLSIFRLNYTDPSAAENQTGGGGGGGAVTTAQHNATAPPPAAPDEEVVAAAAVEQEENNVDSWLKSEDAENVLFPVQGSSSRRLMRKLIQCGTAGGRHSIGERLDNVLVLPYWKNTRLAACLLLHWASHITAISILSFWTTDQNVSPSTWWGSKESSWTALSIIALSTGGVNFLLHIGTVNILDSFYTSMLYVLSNYTLWWSVFVFRKTNLFNLGFIISVFVNNIDANPYAGVLLFIICALHTIFSLMHGLLFVQSAFLSRRFIFYALQPYSRTARQLASNSSTPKSDESGWISTASILTFLCCKYHVAPIDYHQLLIGPNIVRGVRISDMLLVNDWSDFLANLILRLVALTVLASSRQAHGDFKAIIIITLMWAFLHTLYILLSQTVRLISIRRFQVKALYTDIVHGWKNQPPQEQKMQILADILKRYRREAILTSPGEVLMPLI